LVEKDPSGPMRKWTGCDHGLEVGGGSWRRASGPNLKERAEKTFHKYTQSARKGGGVAGRYVPQTGPTFFHGGRVVEKGVWGKPGWKAGREEGVNRGMQVFNAGGIRGQNHFGGGRKKGGTCQKNTNRGCPSRKSNEGVKGGGGLWKRT